MSDIEETKRAMRNLKKEIAASSRNSYAPFLVVSNGVTFEVSYERGGNSMGKSRIRVIKNGS